MKKNLFATIFSLHNYYKFLFLYLNIPEKHFALRPCDVGFRNAVCQVGFASAMHLHVVRGMPFVNPIANRSFIQHLRIRSNGIRQKVCRHPVAQLNERMASLGFHRIQQLILPAVFHRKLKKAAVFRQKTQLAAVNL